MQAIAVSDHRFTTLQDARDFALAGNAILTLESLRTGEHFTYKVRESNKGEVHFVSLLSGPDNENDYFYLGMIRNGRFSLTKASRATVDAPSVKAISFFFRSTTLHPELVVRHEGRCGRCGRTLTVPESIDRGIGPECASKMGGEL